jgi:DNA-binding beta-propeller fold protein YncE
MAERSNRSRSAIRAHLVCTALLGALGVMMLLAPSAFGAIVYFPKAELPATGSTPSSFDSLLAQSVGINEKNGHVLVADSGRGLVYDFSSTSDTAPDVWDGSTTPSGSFGGSGGLVSVAVHSATGDVYVADKTHAVIDKFDQNGNLIASFGDTLPGPDGQLSGDDTPAGSFSPAESSQYKSLTAFAIAVNQATGELYVVDGGHRVVDVFTSSGEYLRQITATPPGLYSLEGGYVASIAVDSISGNVYLADWGTNPVKVYQFNSAGSYVSAWDGIQLPNGASSQTPSGAFTCGTCALISVAVEDSTGHVVVQAYRVLDTFDLNGNFLAPETVHGGAAGIAIKESNGDVYLSSSGHVKVLEPKIVPDVTANPTSGMGTHNATLNGHVDPVGGGDITGCHFEYISNSLYEKVQEYNGPPYNGSGWNAAVQAPCETSPSSSLPYSTSRDVIASVENLDPGTQYRYRLLANNGNGELKDEGEFATVGDYELSANYGSTGSGDGQLDGPNDVAVDQATGSIYVADTGNDRVVKFDSSGGFLAAWGWGVDDGSAEYQVCTSGCQAGISGLGVAQFASPRFIEIDNSTGPTAGAVYVANGADSRVQKFSLSGQLIGNWGDGGTLDFGETGTVGGIAVDPTGDLFVLTTDPPYYWTQISRDGTFRVKIPTETCSAQSVVLGTPGGGGIDTDSLGFFYEASAELGVAVANSNEGKFGLQNCTGYYDQGTPTGLVLSRSTNDLYINHGGFIHLFRSSEQCSHTPHPNNGPPFDLSCAPTNFFGSGELNSARGLAFEEAGEILYAANAGDDDIAVFSPLPRPNVVTGAVSSAGTASGTISGHVDPLSSGTITDCRFEYGTDTTYSLGSVPCSPAAPFSAPSDVDADLAGLTPFATYHYRLVAAGANELATYGADRAFTPGPVLTPTVKGAAAGDETRTSATLTALVNPNGAPTIYRFEYGPDSSYGSRTPLSSSIGDDEADHSVQAAIGNLSPGTTYHFRVLAVNFIGTTTGADQVFNTPDQPGVASTLASGISQTTATLAAQVSPGFRPTTYRFEYGPTAAYGATTPQSALAGADNLSHPVAGTLTGLLPATTYHFRVVATNEIGTAGGADSTFTTAPVVEPPQAKPRCKKGYVKKRGKCVRKKKKHHAKKHHKRGHRNG